MFVIFKIYEYLKACIIILCEMCMEVIPALAGEGVKYYFLGQEILLAISVFISL